MDYSQPFSVLNEKLRPRVTSSNQLYSSLSRLEDRQMGSLRNRFTPYQTTVLPAEPEPEPEPEPEDPEQEDLDCDSLGEGSCADLLPGSNSILITQMNLKDVGEEKLAEEDNVSTHSEEKDTPGELSTEGSRDSPVSVSLTGEDRNQSFINGTIPDLLKSGRPLSRRRTLGHVSETLNEVRREVELSRRRSIKLKAQVDKLQESRDGPGWSQHRERVTEEVLSVLRLLRPLTEPESSTPEPLAGENQLDAALAQLQSVARKLAISHTKQEVKCGKRRGEEDSAVLQQALRDRDEAIEKKKAMEDELLRSKTDMMTLNNQLLEAVQKRLEMSLELEAWKEDFQLILQQQVRAQQEAEQAQRKPSRLGLLRRNNKPLQRPSNFPLPTPTPPTTNSNQIFMPRATVSAAPTPSTPPSAHSQRNWRDKLKMGRISRPGEDAAGQESEFNMGDGFQVVSLD